MRVCNGLMCAQVFHSFFSLSLARSHYHFSAQFLLLILLPHSIPVAFTFISLVIPYTLRKTVFSLFRFDIFFLVSHFNSIYMRIDVVYSNHHNNNNTDTHGAEEK